MSEDDPFSDMTPAQRKRELAALKEWEQQVSDGMTHAERAVNVIDRFEDDLGCYLDAESNRWLVLELEKEFANVERVKRREERDGDD